jgi:site-specific DNA recombinase
VARLLAAVAADESDSKRRRGQRKMQEVAEKGLPHMGGNYRPFGFMDDKITHRSDEADAIRQLTQRALAGESLTSLCRWLVDHETRTVSGAVWRTPVLRQLLLNPRNYGMRQHKGQHHPAVWDPIITADKGTALRTLLTDPARRTNRTARRYLLSRLCRCSRCGAVMYAVPRLEERRYLCRSGHDFGGCGRMAVSAAPLERIITEAVLQRLDAPGLHDALAGRAHDDQQAAALAEQIRADTEQLQELTDLYVARDIDAADWKRARSGIEARRTAARKQLSRLSGTQPIDAYIGQGQALRDQWEGLNLSRQAAIVKALVDHVEILPGVRGTRYVAVDRVRPVWRL